MADDGRGIEPAAQHRRRRPREPAADGFAEDLAKRLGVRGVAREPDLARSFGRPVRRHRDAAGFERQPVPRRSRSTPT